MTAAEAAGRVRLVILDIDGVLTDGRVIIDASGIESKAFHVHDGTGITYLLRGGIDSVWISGRRSSAVEARARELGIEEVHQGCTTKIEAFEETIERRGLAPNEVAYIGDDLIDIPVMRRVGLPIAVADARPEVREAALLVTDLPGGGGAVREAAEFILRARGLWDGIMERYR